MATAVKNDTFEQEVIQSETPVLVDFWAEWCGPCHAVAPVLDRIVEEQAGALKLVKVNIDEERELAERYGIASIPTMILFRDGEPSVSRHRRAAEGRDRAHARPHRRRAFSLLPPRRRAGSPAGSSRCLRARSASPPRRAPSTIVLDELADPLERDVRRRVARDVGDVERVVALPRQTVVTRLPRPP